MSGSGSRPREAAATAARAEAAATAAPAERPRRVGFAGLGIMGSRMAASLARAGFEVAVWNRTRARAEAWVGEHGGTLADTPAELAERSDAVITMVVDGPQVERLLLGEDGVAASGRAGLLCVDCSTISPTVTRALGAELAARGMALVDAPVTGSSPKAEAGTLTIMCGGAFEHLDRARPLLDAMGALIVEAGPLGQGQMLKLVNNAVAAANAATVAQALIVASATGVDLDALVRVMSAGSGGSAMLDLKAAPMRAHDYTTFFKLEHMLKDVRLCLEEAQAAGVPFPAAAAARDVLAAGMGRGLAEMDFGALLEVLEGYAGRRM